MSHNQSKTAQHSPTSRDLQRALDHWESTRPTLALPQGKCGDGSWRVF